VTGALRDGFRALQYRDFRVFLSGALISNSGTWLQNLAVPYVLFELTGRSLWVGLFGFAQFLPAFVMGPIGGMLADRGDRRRSLLIIHGLALIPPLLLWLTWVGGVRNPYVVLALSAASGVFGGLMIPIWQAFVPSMVPKDVLPSAITLNSTQFNASRAIGPALAGILLATAGPEWAFLANSLSFLAVMGVLLVVRGEHGKGRKPSTDGLIEGFTSALSYIRHRTGIMVSMSVAAMIGFCGAPLIQFTVVFGEEVFQADERVVGLMASAIGLGSVAIAPAVSTWSARVPRSRVLTGSLPFYGLAVTAFALAPNWQFGIVALLAVGAGFLTSVATSNTAVQMIVADEMRGRVMSVRIMCFTLSLPLGSLLQGWLADQIGPRATVAGAGLAMLAISLTLVLRPRLLATVDNNDDTPDRPRPAPVGAG
jgi:MFS family permease